MGLKCTSFVAIQGHVILSIANPCTRDTVLQSLSCMARPNLACCSYFLPTLSAIITARCLWLVETFGCRCRFGYFLLSLVLLRCRCGQAFQSSHQPALWTPCSQCLQTMNVHTYMHLHTVPVPAVCLIIFGCRMKGGWGSLPAQVPRQRWLQVEVGWMHPNHWVH